MKEPSDSWQNEHPAGYPSGSGIDGTCNGSDSVFVHSSTQITEFSVYMEYFESILVALLQGVTEFLPISSSGHIVIVQALLGQDLTQGMTFNIVTHFGTLGSISIYFYRDLKEMVQSAIQTFKHPFRIADRWEEDETVRFNIYLLLSMIPAGVAGFTVRDQLDAAFANPVGVSAMFLFTGFVLFATRFYLDGRRRLTAKNTFMVGIAQAVALIPGVSRSGMTISMAVFLGINREDVVRFSFIMMLPVIAGATLVELLGLEAGQLESGYVPHLILGFFVSLVSGYFSLKYLIILFKSKGIHHFAWYCWIIGLAGLAYFL
ncbi:MAG: undecaprenyl-diphosphate phosphatase [Balneolaceae bacterium]